MAAIDGEYAEYKAVLHERGWVAVEGVFSREEADAVAALAVEQADSPEPGAQGEQPVMRKVESPFRKHIRFRRFVLDPRMRRLMRAMLGGKEPLLAVDQIFLKPPRHGSAKPYHQDNAYFQCSPAEETLTAWIALDDVDESNGCLRYIDGSHREELLEHRVVAGAEHHMTPDMAAVDMGRESCAIIGQGGVIIHHSGVLHTSHANRSDRWRRAYATHWVSPDVTSKGRVLDDPCFRLPSYAEVLSAS